MPWFYRDEVPCMGAWPLIMLRHDFQMGAKVPNVFQTESYFCKVDSVANQNRVPNSDPNRLLCRQDRLQLLFVCKTLPLHLSVAVRKPEPILSPEIYHFTFL